MNNLMNIGITGLSNRSSQVITINLRLTEHANIFLNTCPVVVFSHLYLQPLLPCTRSQQCFITATIRSFGHFVHVELPLSLGSYHFLAHGGGGGGEGSGSSQTNFNYLCQIWTISAKHI